MRIATFAVALAAAVAAGLVPVRAQESLVTPSQRWRTVETKHFMVHYPAGAEAWTLDVASRIDGAYDAVSALVGFRPPTRITLIVADPNNLSNGFALPFLADPVIFFWPTPPDPYGGLGAGATWGEMLSVHEYAHIAHLARPSRNPSEVLLQKVSTDFGPIAVNAPRWAAEGYATWVEGRITGAGRPHSAARAAILREWALAGALPTYGELDESPRFLGGSMAYLVGSAYLEWLVARPGQSDSSLPRVWRRMTARTRRSFDEAFAGVFGGTPEELYGRFTAEITARAIELERALAVDSAALGAGRPRTVQRLAWFTGAPALSPNDSLIALARETRTRPRSIVIWPARPRSDTAAARRTKEALALDSLDVAAIPWRPASLPVIERREPQGGESFDAPRWLPDGKHLLLTRNTGPGDGVIRRDLFEWGALDGSVRRVTRAGGIRHADAMPDGRAAIADRCLEGICGLVRVDLATGALTPLVDGTPRMAYERPRVSPDGRTVAASRQTDEGWRVVLIDVATRAVRVMGPADGAERYDAAWRADGRRLVVVSEAGGVPNLEEIDVATGAVRALTRTASAVRAPEPRADDGGVYFLRLHARGLDLERVAADSVPALPPVSPLASAAPMAPVAFEPREPADTFPAVALTPRDYGLGPRQWRFLPTGTYGAEGGSAGLMAGEMDPAGKLTALAQGMLGTEGSWQGGSLAAAWRGWPVVIRGEGFYSQDYPSRQWGRPAPDSLDAAMAGGDLAAEWARDLLTQRHAVTLGGSLASFRGDGGAWGTRALGWLAYDARLTQNIGPARIDELLSLEGSAGRTDGADWSRGRAALTLSAGMDEFAIELSGSYGETSSDAPAFEQFAIGGLEPPFFEPALYSQRVAVPAMPAGVYVGTKTATLGGALPLGLVRPYYWSGTAGTTVSDWGRWEQLVGIETGIASDGIWYARLPGLRVLAGVAYAFGGEWRYQTRFYVVTTFSP